MALTDTYVTTGATVIAITKDHYVLLCRKGLVFYHQRHKNAPDTALAVGNVVILHYSAAEPSRFTVEAPAESPTTPV